MVQTFYKGNLMSEGWSKFGEVTVNTVTSADARCVVIGQINELGRIISCEWAKDASTRKITTSDLRALERVDRDCPTERRWQRKANHRRAASGEKNGREPTVTQ